ncbi:unnamed protein product, partial [Brenthis ino]
MGTLKVLMWKHLMVRKRRFIHTPVEIISPAILFIILFCVKNYFLGKGKFDTDELYSVQKTDPVKLGSVENIDKIFYTPETDFSNRLMRYVEEYYELHRADKGYMAYPKPKMKPVNDPTMLQNLTNDFEVTHGSAAIVLFKGIDLQETKPNKLIYTIRLADDFKTYSYDSLNLGPHYNYGTVYERFMKLQWAIDSSYLKILGVEKEVPQNVILQEFPYKTSKQNHVAAVICQILAVFCWLSLLLVFVFLVARLLEERVTGIQELIKMVGVSNNMLSLTHVLNSMPAGIVFSVVPTILVSVTVQPLISNSNPFLIFLMLILYFISVVSMAFMCSYIANNTQYTVTIATFAYIFLDVPARLLGSYTVPRWALPLCGLLPHVPMDWFWKEVTALEQFDMGLKFSNFVNSHNAQTGSALSCYFCLIIQSVIFFTLSWYLSHVRPGPYGQALSWNFVCKRQYWSSKRVTPEEQEELEELDDDVDPEFFEPPPKDVEVGIKIVNVSKVFDKQRALNNVSLDVYKGEITVLLGHNGAGKTTLMSIITGMLKATEGKVYVEGLDTETQKEEMRRYLGLCPQHNLFFPDLTVLEHVIFFTMLKGVTYTEAKQSATKLLERLGLSDKLNSKSGQLSGGMKRRLQLGCALAGDARVLVLDEPTAGLDVETRRELWDLLLSLRESRTVLLSTHFMEEAEALGERVAALRGGRLRCRASTMRLKRALGTGYRLSFTTVGIPNEPAITAAILSTIPEASLKETSLNSISYNLPSRCSDKFPRLFNQLESHRSELGINTIGVGISTLEEVFLKLCSDVTTTFSDDAVDGESIEPTYKILTGLHLYKNQLIELLKRQLKYVWSKKISFLIMQVISPILLMCFFTLITNNNFTAGAPDVDKTIALDLNVYDQVEDRKVLYNINSDIFKINAIKKRNPHVVFESTDDVSAAVLRAGYADVTEYNKYLVGIELNDTHATVLFTTVVRHAAPVALNLLSNLLATSLSDAHAITTYNNPIETYRRPTSTQKEPDEGKYQINTSLWAFGIVFIILTTVVNNVSLPCKERASGARHLHVMAGCAPALHWAATLLAHAALHALALVLPALVVAAALDQDGTINQPDFLGTLFVILMLGIVAFLALMYLVSFNFGERGAGVMLIGFIMAFGVITPGLSQIPKDDQNSFLRFILVVAAYVMPPHTFTIATMQATEVARFNKLISSMAASLEALKLVADTSEPKSYFSFADKCPGPAMLVLFFQYIFYMSVVILTECGLFNSFYDRVFNARYRPAPAPAADDMVRAEKAYVDKAIALPPDQIRDAMLVNDVHKNYWRVLGKSCSAVQGVSFSVKKGECFGLLGVNGAGKSTIFKMLTAVECTTKGSIFANGHFMNMLSGQYLRSLGYCPQFLALDGFLSGRDNLVLLLTLRGLAPRDARADADAWIDTVGLTRYAGRAVRAYSGGCARRLGAAAALCRGATALLDEPTAGVDVAARRRVWAAVRRAHDRALVVCSHSMDEMEALCGRIAIMSRGRVRALGEAAALRAAHAAGHAVLLRLARGAGARADRDETDSTMSELTRLKASLQEKFNCTLRDEHKTRLHYHINDTLRYSDLFSELERLKSEFPTLLEDYSVTETTLEEVFLSFAKEEIDEGPTPV